MFKSTLTLALLTALAATSLSADPCGMVPPMWTGPGPAIERVGVQKTYVFYKDGIETFAVRPGFEGKVADFGMLIPVPTTPAIKKISDDTFAHIAAAIDPPEIQVYVGPQRGFARRAGLGGGAPQADGALEYAREDEVRVVKEEAMGMYQVVVLDAGSARALERWMTEHEYTYPNGMDDVCQDYVDAGWLFVAVKAKVGQKKGVDPKPGMDGVEEDRPAGSVFDGHVQGMAFRFKTDHLVVPMRLASYNAGETHNAVYILSDTGTAIRDIPQDLVKRQISGEELYLNLTQPLPLRIIGGDYSDIPEWQLQHLEAQRDPSAKNGHARELFAADLLAARLGELALEFEEKEKQLLNISERLSLRGKEIDELHHAALKHDRDTELNAVLMDLLDMTMTVVDGDFQREVLARDNLHFLSYEMPGSRNKPTVYNARLAGPEPENKSGKLWVDESRRAAVLDVARLLKGKSLPERKEAIAKAESNGESIFAPPGKTVTPAPESSLLPWLFAIFAALAALGLGVGIGFKLRKGSASALLILGTGLAFAVGSSATVDAGEQPDTRIDADTAALLADLHDPEQAPAATDKLVAQGERAVAGLITESFTGRDIAARGWAIVALSEIGGDKVDQRLKVLHTDTTQNNLVRTWAAAGRVSIADSKDELMELARLAGTMPALGRPVAMKLVDGGMGQDAESLIQLSVSVPSLNDSLRPVILALPTEELVETMVNSPKDDIRRTATSYLGGKFNQGDKDVLRAVIDVYKPDPGAARAPWDGGALYVPSIQWNKQDASELVANLLEWGVWCDNKEKFKEVQQVQNNIRSVGLARVVGYRTDWGNHDIRWWLAHCGKALGKDVIKGIVENQGVAHEQRYQNVLDQLD